MPQRRGPLSARSKGALVFALVLSGCGARVDSGIPDSTVDASIDDDSVDAGGSLDATAETSPIDSTVGDTGFGDTGSSDTGSSDTGSSDTGSSDTGSSDTGIADTGTVDTGLSDTGIVDTGIVDTGIVDTGLTDTGFDADSAADADSGPVGAHCGCPDPLSKLCPAVGEIWTACVSALDPQNGCGATSCSPCSFLHASAQCVAGGCAMLKCDPGYADCAGTKLGCATDLHADKSNCGACGKACGTGESCVEGVCTTGCLPPFTDCGGGVCANLSTNALHCGSCTVACGAGGGTTATCSGGVCGTTPVACPAGLTMCSGKCVDTLRDPANCGSCGTYCSRRLAAGLCSAGSCTCPGDLTTCDDGKFGKYCLDLNISNYACGACGAPVCVGVCRPGGCVSTSALTVYSGVVNDFVVDDTSVYVVDATAGVVRKVAKTGGTPSTLATGQAKPVHVTTDATHVYWTNALGAAVMRVPKDGSSAPTVVAVASQPSELVVDATDVYWINETDWTLRRAAKTGGGAVTTLISPTTPPHTALSGLVAAEETLALIVANMPTQAIYTLAKATPTPLSRIAVTAIGAPNAVAIDNAYLYGSASHLSAGIVQLMPLSGTASTTIWATNTSDGVYYLPRGPLLADNGWLYFRYGGGIVKTYACPSATPTAVLGVDATRYRVDSTSLFWTDGTMVGRVPK